MSQDTQKRHQHEHEDAHRKQEREELAMNDSINDARLHGDGLSAQELEHANESEVYARTAADIKDVYALLPEFGHDELKRLNIVDAGTQLVSGAKFIDLRNRFRGETAAIGEEIVAEELLVPKRGTDYEIWNKLLDSREVSETPAEPI